jgi:hypothetical protein
MRQHAAQLRSALMQHAADCDELVRTLRRYTGTVAIAVYFD